MLAFHRALPALKLVEQRIDVAAEPVEFGDAEALHALVEAAVQAHVVRDARDFAERLDQFIFEAPRERDRAEAGDDQADEAGEQADADIVEQGRGIAAYFDRADARSVAPDRSEEHTSDLQSLMRISYAVFCLK